MKVLKQSSQELNSELYAIPDLKSYDWGNFPPQALGLYGGIHHRNASVALQLARHFYNQHQYGDLLHQVNGYEYFNNSTERSSILPTAKPFKLCKEEALGLRLCQWPGRAHIITKGKNLSYFLDGAHTSLSVQACRSWFETVSETQQKDLKASKTSKILIFNTTKDRLPKQLLAHFATCHFDKVIFTANLTRTENSKNSDNTNHTTSNIGQLRRCEEHKVAWQELQYEKLLNNKSKLTSTAIQDVDEENCETVNHPFKTPCYTTKTINDALELANSFAYETDGRDFKLVQVLVTGSIHLVGGVLKILDPDIFNRTDDEKEEMISEEYEKLDTY